MLSTTPASGRSDGAQNSWKLDNSTASNSAGSSQHIEHRAADVAAQQAAVAVGRQHGVQHRRGGRLAVGAGHHQPAPRRPVVPGRVQAPGQLDVAPDGHARRRGRGQHRRRSAGNPGWSTTRAYSVMCWTASDGSTVATPRSAYGRSMIGSSSHTVGVRPESGQRRLHRPAGHPATGHQHPRARHQNIKPVGPEHVRHRSRPATRRRTGRRPDRRRSP